MKLEIVLSKKEAARLTALSKRLKLDTVPIVKRALRELHDRAREPPEPRSLTLDEQIALMKDRGWAANQAARQAGLWVLETGNLALAATRNELNDWSVAMFWIRLYELLNELLEDWTKQLAGPSLAQELRGDGQDERCSELVSLAKEISAALTDDEKLWIEQRRHFQVHPFQNDYRPRREPGGGVRLSRPARLLGGKMIALDAHEESHFRAVQHQDDFDIARTIGVKILPQLERMWSVARLFYRLDQRR